MVHLSNSSMRSNSEEKKLQLNLTYMKISTNSFKMSRMHSKFVCCFFFFCWYLRSSGTFVMSMIAHLKCLKLLGVHVQGETGVVNHERNDLRFNLISDFFSYLAQKLFGTYEFSETCYALFMSFFSIPFLFFVVLVDFTLFFYLLLCHTLSSFVAVHNQCNFFLVISVNSKKWFMSLQLDWNR